MSNRKSRDRLIEERRRQAAAERRKRNLWVGLSVVVVIAVVVAVFAIVQNNRTSTGVAGAELPALVSDDGGPMVFGDGDTTVAVWLDFQCPNCKNFEAVYGKAIDEAVADGTITLEVHPLSFLDDNLDNDSSALAANAFGCSGAAGPEKSLDYQGLLFEKQPPEQPGVDAWTAADLVTWGGDVGISGESWEQCVNDNTYGDWVEQVAASQVDAGVTGTPTVFVDGERFNLEQDLTPVLTGSTS